MGSNFGEIVLAQAGTELVMMIVKALVIELITAVI